MTAPTRRRARRAQAAASRQQVQEDVRPHLRSSTALALEALRTGVLPRAARRPEEIPHERHRMQAGDPDDGTLQNEYNGEDTPGGSTPTPDQNDVDKIGRAYGLQDEDNGGMLRCAAEVLGGRDRKRSELRAPRTPHF